MTAIEGASSPLWEELDALLQQLKGGALARAEAAIAEAEAAVTNATAPLEEELSREDAELQRAMSLIERAQQAEDRAAAEIEVEHSLQQRAAVAARLTAAREAARQAQAACWRRLLEETLADGAANGISDSGVKKCGTIPLLVDAGVMEEGLVDSDFQRVNPEVAGDPGWREVEGRRVAAMVCHKRAVAESLQRAPAEWAGHDSPLLMLHAEVVPRPDEGMGLLLTNSNLVGEVDPGSAAEASGLRTGDLVVATDGGYLGERLITQILERGRASYRFGVVRPITVAACEAASDVVAGEATDDRAEASVRLIKLAESLSQLPGLDQGLPGSSAEPISSDKEKGVAPPTRAVRDSEEEQVAGEWGGVRFLRVEPVDGSAITVEWELNNASCGLEISHYHLEWREVGREPPWQCTDASRQLPMTTVTKKNLDPSSAYQFRVRACDASGHWHPFCASEAAVRPDGEPSAPPPVARDVSDSLLARQRLELQAAEEARVATLRAEYAERLDELERRCLAAEAEIDPAEKERRFERAKAEARTDVEREANAKVELVMRNAAADIRDRVKAAEERMALAVARAVDEALKKAEETAAQEKRRALRQQEVEHDTRVVALQTRLGAGVKHAARQLEGRQKEAMDEAVRLAVLQAEQAAEQRHAADLEDAVAAAIHETEAQHRHSHVELERQLLTLRQQLHATGRSLKDIEHEKIDVTARMAEDTRLAAAEAAAVVEARWQTQVRRMEERWRAQLQEVAQGRVSLHELIRLSSDQAAPLSASEANKSEADAFDFEHCTAIVPHNPSAAPAEMSAAPRTASIAVEKAGERVRHLRQLYDAAMAGDAPESVATSSSALAERLREACSELDAAQERCAVASLRLPCVPVAAAIDGFSIAVDWLAADSADAGKYHLQWREVDAIAWSDSTASSQLKVTCCTKAGLRTHVAYEFRVRAAATAHSVWGPWSAPSEPTKPSLTAAKLPSRPLVKPTAGGRVAVSWAPPQLSGRLVQYELQWKRAGADSWSEDDRATCIEPFHTTDPLQLTSIYVFRVRAELQGYARKTWTECGPFSAPVRPTLQMAPSQGDRQEGGRGRVAAAHQRPGVWSRTKLMGLD